MLSKTEILKNRELVKPLLDRIRHNPESLPPSVIQSIKYDWPLWARDNQLEQFIPIDTWSVWFINAGRGFGKTRTGAQWVNEQAISGNMKRIALIGRTPDDLERVMILGESGIVETCPPEHRPRYNKRSRTLTWSNGAQAFTYSSEVPSSLRGPQHDGFWADELAAYRFLMGEDGIWPNLMMGLRLFPADGRPRGIVTTTPRPLELIKGWATEFEEDQYIRACMEVWKKGTPSGIPWTGSWELMCEMVSQAVISGKRVTKREVRLHQILERRRLRNMFRYMYPKGSVWITKGTTFDNAINWPPERLMELVERYRGSRLARQELQAEILEDTPDALWTTELIENRILPFQAKLPRFRRITVAVDPQKMSYGAARKKKNDETGICVAGLSENNEVIVLDDASIDGIPEVWAKRVIDTCITHKADRIVVEGNAGGQMAESVLRAAAKQYPEFHLPEIVLVNASTSKRLRAEPVSVYYRNGQVWHYGRFSELEKQMTTWSPLNDPESPDRVDALVYAITDLLVQNYDDGDRRLFGYGGFGVRPV